MRPDRPRSAKIAVGNYAKIEHFQFSFSQERKLALNSYLDKLSYIFRTFFRGTYHFKRYTFLLVFSRLKDL